MSSLQTHECVCVFMCCVSVYVCIFAVYGRPLKGHLDNIIVSTWYKFFLVCVCIVPFVSVGQVVKAETVQFLSDADEKVCELIDKTNPKVGNSSRKK